MPTIVASAQITIIDSLDFLITSSVAPVNPSINQLWVDNGVTPNVMKKWNGTSWDITGSQIFRVQPTTAQAYNVGDLWLNATVGSWTNELLKCVTTKASGVAFNVAHWALATKYTDDTAVNNLKFGARNLLLNSGTAITASTYNIVNLSASLIKPNTIYTIVIKANVDVGQRVGAWFNGGANPAKIFDRVAGDNIYVGTTTSPASVTVQGINFYNYPSGATSATIYWACMYEGDIRPPIDYISAPEDIQAQITAANLLITKASSDSILSAGTEKSQQLQLWNAIIGEYAGLLAQGNTYGSTLTAAYTAAYTALGTYLNGGSAWTLGATTLWLGTNLATDTTGIVAATYRTNWANYYNAKIALQNDLYTLAAKKATDAIRVGGTNHCLNSEAERTFGANEIGKIVGFVGGESVMFSFAANYVGTQALAIAILNGGAGTSGTTVGRFDVTNRTSYDIFSIPVTLPAVLDNLRVAGWLAGSGEGTGKAKKFKVEIGNKVTDYSPSTEDVNEIIAIAKAKADAADYLLQALTDDPITLTGTNIPLLISKVIQMRDQESNVRGGMSGLNDNIGFWTGGTYEDAILGVAKNILNKNGNFRLGAGLIDFDVASQVMLISALIRTAVSGDRLEISNSNNSITIYDYSGLEKVKISPKIVSPRSEIGGSTTTTTTIYVDHYNELNGDGAVDIGSTETITLDPTKFFTIVTPAINYSLLVSGEYDGLTKIHYLGEARVSVGLFDVSKAEYVWRSNKTVSSGTSSISEEYGTIAANTLTGMKGSVYRVDVTITISHEGPGDGMASASISAGQTLSGILVNNISEIGLNGFNFIKSANQWLHLGDDDFSRRGPIDIPAGLGGGTVAANGGYSQGWGLSFSSERTTTTTTIHHNVTDTKFTVSVTPKSSFTWYLSSITAASSPTANDGHIVIVCSTTTAVFDFVIVRTPY